MMCDLTLCANQVMAFFRCLDERDYDGLLALLAPDAQWHRQGKILVGHEQVHQALKLRSSTQRIAHLITNLVADHSDPHQCVMRGYMLVIRHDSGSTLNGPAPLSGIESLRTLHIRLARHGEQWKINQLYNDAIAFEAV